MYVTAEWTGVPGPGGSAATTAENQTSAAVIWDSIITAPSADHLANVGPATRKKLAKSAAGRPIDPARGRLAFKNQRPKYQITHPSGRVATAADVRLRLHYNVQPWVGFLTWNQDRDLGRWRALDGRSVPFDLPAVKKKDEPKKARA